MRTDEVHQYVRNAMKTLAPEVAADEMLSTLNATTGLASETGEINEIIKKRYFHGHPRTPEVDIHMKKEIGDLMWYVALICVSQGFDLSEILDMNIAKLKARYPEGFSTERSMNRKTDDI